MGWAMHNARHDSPRIHRNLRPIAARLIPLIKILTGEQWTAFKNKTTSGSRAFIRGHRVETTGRRTPPTISFAKTFLVISCSPPALPFYIDYRQWDLIHALRGFLSLERALFISSLKFLWKESSSISFDFIL